MRLIAIFFLLCFSLQLYAGCSDRVPEEIALLLKNKEFVEAERISSLLVEKKGDITSYSALLNVYLFQTFEKVINVDTEGLGINREELVEGDSFRLTPEQATKRVQVSWHINEQYGEKIEQIMEIMQGKWPKDKKGYICQLNYFKQTKKYDKYLLAQVQALNNVSSKDAEFEDQLLSFADTFMESGNIDFVSQLYSSLLKNYSTNPQLLFNYAMVLNRKSDITGAVEYFEKAYEHDKRNPIVSDHLIEKSFYAQDLVKTEKYLLDKVNSQLDAVHGYFELAMLKLPYDGDAAFNYLESYQKMLRPLGEKYASRLQFTSVIQNSIKNGISNEDFYFLAEKFMKSGSGNLAIPLIMKLIESNPENYHYFFMMASNYEKEGYLLQAYDYTVRAAEVAKKNNVEADELAEILYDAGRLAFKMNWFANARQHFRDAKVYNNDLLEINYILGMLSGQLQDFEGAKKYFKLCVKKEATKKEVCSTYLEGFAPAGN